ncbi:hypothetical protein EDD18DRAFT_786133 [Armillaria luteobubalina]|uniref:Uncharacterized protein n=1 Tax=Armillaria luteobubalina TaxID=153913 RepID=A0AA39QEJ0_9AGAR|nr:hypothetical protein EDD18DRAFT_786133 [Armillaria luteobubalina]
MRIIHDILGKHIRHVHNTMHCLVPFPRLWQVHLLPINATCADEHPSSAQMLFSFFLFYLLSYVYGASTSSDADAADPLAGVVSHFNVNLTLESLVDNLANLSFTASNPLIVEITLDRVAVSAGVGGVEYVSFDNTFGTPIVVPILGTADSGVIENVALTQDGLATLDIVPDGFLDILNLDLFLREATIGGIGGISVNDTGLTATDISTTWVTPFN